jgi:hypothetical protein
MLLEELREGGPDDQVGFRNGERYVLHFLPMLPPKDNQYLVNSTSLNIFCDYWEI